jgi:eukaryotic-like serine/threonine-protein kinase
MIGRTVGHYRILGHLGDGGMGVVYRAEDTRLGRVVALKLLPPELTRDAEAKRRFEREARAAALLDHPNICTTYDFGEAEGDGQMYIAMAYCDGESLADRVTRGPLSLDDAIRIVEQICRGLGKAHASGVVHRDVKPANVMLTTDGVVKIVDFGLAKLSAGSQLTKSHTSLGTAAYMAPEQLRGEEIGPQADIWGTGIVLFELLTGTRPFRGEYAEALSYSILNEQPSTITELRPDLPAEVDRIIKKMLRKDPLQRYASTDEVIAELEVLRTPSSGSGKSGPRSTKVREPLRAGAKLGPYEIVEPLGSGGMGDVYRARDTRLGRQVAIKVLAPEFSEDAERKQRFQREAKTISSLSHPNICTLFDVGEQEGTDYLVMEYLEGETLAERLTRGALPLTELLKTGIQIGEALGRAHQQGIVHRDLKPGNVMLTKTGTVKLLDFGLAKDVGTVTTTQRRRSGSPSPDKPLTAEGAIVGTLAYMAPEQVEGQEADARSDIFAYGVILYEMATGKRAFEGATRAKLMAAILEREPPPLSDVKANTPAGLEHVINRCLAKSRDDRSESAHDVAEELRWIREAPSATKLPPTHRRIVFAAVGIATVAVAIVVAIVSRTPSFKPYQMGNARPIAATPATEIEPAISPDGKFVAYSASTPQGFRIFVRSVDGGRPVLLAGDLNGDHHWPRWSPDGSRIVFVANNAGYVVPALGGSAKRVIEAANDSVETPSWSPDGNQFAYATGKGVWVRSVDGNIPPRLVVAWGGWAGDELSAPTWAPDGRRLAYVSGVQPSLGNVSTNSVWVTTLSGRPPERGVRISDSVRANSSPAWAPDGKSILFVSNTGGVFDVYQQPIASDGTPMGPAARLTTGLNTFSIGLSGDGSRLVYSIVQRRSNIWMAMIEGASVAHTSAAREITTENEYIEFVSLSHDGKSLAYDSNRSGNYDIYTLRLDGGEPTQITTNPANDFCPTWSPDGREIAFQTTRDATRDIYVITAEGQQERPAVTAPSDDFRPDWSSDGTQLVYSARDSTGNNIAVVTRRADGTWSAPRALARRNINNAGPVKPSPDGKLILFEDEGSLWVLSTSGGAPRVLADRHMLAAVPSLGALTAWVGWSRDGSVAYFTADAPNGGENFWAMPVTGGEPRLVLVSDGSRLADRREFATDGQRIFFISSIVESDIAVMELRR